jgi:hypothetical protein
MGRRAFSFAALVASLLWIAAFALYLWSPGRMFRLTDNCSHVLHCREGKLFIIHYDFGRTRQYGDERDAYAAICVRTYPLDAVLSVLGILPGIWALLWLRQWRRRRHRRGFDVLPVESTDSSAREPSHRHRPPP